VEYIVQIFAIPFHFGVPEMNAMTKAFNAGMVVLRWSTATRLNVFELRTLQRLTWNPAVHQRDQEEEQLGHLPLLYEIVLPNSSYTGPNRHITRQARWMPLISSSNVIINRQTASLLGIFHQTLHSV
jgi:hypothetical protein